MTKSLHAPEYEKLRLFLIKARKLRDLTQSEIAFRLNKPQSFIAKYERGERRLDIVELIKVCKALGINPQDAISEIAGDL